MQYLGGKVTVAKYIVEEILKRKTTQTKYVEPFVGGAAILQKISSSFEENYASDSHKELILMYQALQNGWLPPSKVSREEYLEIKNSSPSALRGFVGFCCSYGGKWWGGYAKSEKNGENYASYGHNSLLRLMNETKESKVFFEEKNYKDIAVDEKTIVYADPPYASTTKYSTGNFDSIEFWKTARIWKEKGALVFVSEYNCPIEDIQIVWSKEKRKTLGSSENSSFATEKLYLL